VVSQAARLEVFQVASQVGEDSQVGGSPRYHNSHSQHQDGLAREAASGQARFLPSHSHSHSHSHNLSSLPLQSNLHRHRHSQLLLRLRDPQ